MRKKIVMLKARLQKTGEKRPRENIPKKEY